MGPHQNAYVVGKTTTLRMLLGLVEPTQGQALVDGCRYSELADPLRQVGAVLEASSFHPGRTTRDRLRVQTAAAGISPRGADEVLERVGLAKDAGGGWPASHLACGSVSAWPPGCSATQTC